MLMLSDIKNQFQNHFNAQVTKVAIGFTIIALTACSSTTKKMVIAPQISDIKSTVYALKTAQVNVMDLRPNSHVVAIHREDKAIELVSAHDHLDSVINGLYVQSLKNNGLSLDENSLNNIELIINTAEVNVFQELMKYKTTSQLTLTAKVSSGDKTLTKTFNNKGKSDGVLSADLAVLERNFNQQISDTIALIVNDNEIQQLLK
ncbi:MAG: YajG family lipoprotein [Thalassotalea sp.]|nr:YajG family lipoprotein [Thalassotalea sp.]